MEVIIESRCSTKVFSAHIEVPLEIASQGFRPPFFKHADDLPFTHDLIDFVQLDSVSTRLPQCTFLSWFFILTSDSLMFTPCTLRRNLKRWSTANNCIDDRREKRVLPTDCVLPKVSEIISSNIHGTVVLQPPANIRSEIYESTVCIDANSFHGSLGEHLQVPWISHRSWFLGQVSKQHHVVLFDCLPRVSSFVQALSGQFKIPCMKYPSPATERSQFQNSMFGMMWLRSVHMCALCIKDHQSIIAAPWSVQQVQATDLLVHGASRLYVHVPNEL